MEKYIDGLDMSQFKHIPEISSYNRNYYLGFDNDLLFGKSDDIDKTRWYLIKGEYVLLIGETSEIDDLLYKDTF